MRFWCASSQGVAWSWSWQPYLGVWAFVILIALIYWRILRRHDAHARAGWGPGRTRRIGFFVAGLVALWAALDWPLGPLGAGYLASVHMVQYLLISLIAPPLLLLGVPAPAYEALRARSRVTAILRNLTQPLIAFFAFNIVITATHWPALVDPLMASQLGSFALDLTWLAAGLVFWWPLLSPVPHWPRFTPGFRLLYLGLNGIVIRPPFFILLFSKYPAYATYELAPPLPGVSALADQQLAAGIMKLGSALVMVTAMIFVFADWVRASRGSASAA